MWTVTRWTTRVPAWLWWSVVTVLCVGVGWVSHPVLVA